MMGKIGNSDCTSSHIIFRQAIMRQTDQQTFKQRTDRPEKEIDKRQKKANRWNR